MSWRRGGGGGWSSGRRGGGSRGGYWGPMPVMPVYPVYPMIPLDEAVTYDDLLSQDEETGMSGMQIAPSLKSSLQFQWWEGSEDALDEEYGSSSVSFPVMSGKFEQGATFGLDDLGADDFAGSMQLRMGESAGRTVCLADKCVGPIAAALIGYVVGRGSLKAALAAGIAWWLFSGTSAGKAVSAKAGATMPALPGEGAK